MKCFRNILKASSSIVFIIYIFSCFDIVLLGLSTTNTWIKGNRCYS